MKMPDAYQSLLDMYDGAPFKTSKVEDSLIEVLRLQFSPEEADLAVKYDADGLTGRGLYIGRQKG